MITILVISASVFFIIITITALIPNMRTGKRIRGIKIMEYKVRLSLKVSNISL